MLPEGKKSRLRKFGPYEFEFVAKFGFDKFTWIGTHTPLKSKCHKISYFMTMIVRKCFH